MPMVELSLLVLVLSAPPSPAPPDLFPRDLRSVETASFDRANLFDFIDGGAEVYLAYDFRTVQVRTYQVGEVRIAIEAYDMGKADDAYGVLTVDPTGEHVSIGSMARYGAGLLRFCKGKWFVRVFAERETLASRAAVLDLGRGVAAAVPESAPSPALLARLPALRLLPDSATYFHSHVTLNQLHYLAEGNLLHLGPEVNAVLASYAARRSEAKLLLVEYPSERHCRDAAHDFVTGYLLTAHHGEERLIAPVEQGRVVGLHLRPPYLVMVFEAPDAEAASALLDRAAGSVKKGDADGPPRSRP